MEHFANRKGSTTFVNDGVSKVMNDFNVEQLPGGKGSSVKVAPGARVFSFGTLKFGEKRRLEVIPLRDQQTRQSGKFAYKYEGLAQKRHEIEPMFSKTYSKISKEISKRKTEIARSESNPQNSIHSGLEFDMTDQTHKLWKPLHQSDIS
jgi:hypothetical protein